MEYSTRKTRVEVDLSRLQHNYLHLRNLHSQQRIMTVVKADAYGQGLLPISRFLQGLGQDLFGVALVEEAIALRQGGVTGRILVLSPPQFGSRSLYADHQIEMTVPSLHHLTQALGHPGEGAVQAHLKLDTGLGRIGLQKENLAELFRLLTSSNFDPARLKIIGVFSHLAESENLESDFAERQRERFDSWCGELGSHPALRQLERHLANSAGLLRGAGFHYDYARVGYALWGPQDFSPAGQAPQSNAALQQVTRLVCPISHLKTLQAGDTVGYSRTYQAQANESIATLPIGYGDGFPRALSNRGQAAIHGQRVPIVGNVSMDQTTISLGTENKISARVGDAVVLLGDGPEEPRLNDMARAAGTIGYEVLTRLNRRLPRVYLYNGKEVPAP